MILYLISSGPVLEMWASHTALLHHSVVNNYCFLVRLCKTEGIMAAENKQDHGKQQNGFHKLIQNKEVP